MELLGGRNGMHVRRTPCALRAQGDVARCATYTFTVRNVSLE